MHQSFKVATLRTPMVGELMVVTTAHLSQDFASTGQMVSHVVGPVRGPCNRKVPSNCFTRVPENDSPVDADFSVVLFSIAPLPAVISTLKEHCTLKGYAVQSAGKQPHHGKKKRNQETN